MRILKGRICPGGGGLLFLVAGATIRVRILKDIVDTTPGAGTIRCRGYDPGEDTESFRVLVGASGLVKVAGATIRVRILKVLPQGGAAGLCTLVAGATIRVRILKAGSASEPGDGAGRVAGATIRVRILKGRRN